MNVMPLDTSRLGTIYFQ